MTDFNAFKIFIGSAADFPVLRQNSMVLEPGREHFVELHADFIDTEPAFRKLAIVDRNCSFEDEGSLDYYMRYSHTSCIFECTLKLAAVAANCTPWHLPPGPGSLACDPWAARTFARAMQEGEQDCEHRCLPDCRATLYSVASHTSAPFRGCDSRNLNLSPLCDLASPSSPHAWAEAAVATYSDPPGYVLDRRAGLMRPQFPTAQLQEQEMLKALLGGSTLPEYNAFDKDIAVVNFYFGKPTTFGESL
jgi:hypothetical protein